MVNRTVLPALVAATVVLVLSAELAYGDPRIPPPPPLPAKGTPVPPPLSAPLEPSITSAIIMMRTGQRFTTVHNLHLGDHARFVVGWGVNERSTVGVTGQLEILKGTHVLYRRTLHGQSGALGGTLYADVHLASGAAVGDLSARFVVRLGGTVERTLHFKLLPSTG